MKVLEQKSQRWGVSPDTRKQLCSVASEYIENICYFFKLGFKVLQSSNILLIMYPRNLNILGVLKLFDRLN